MEKEQFLKNFGMRIKEARIKKGWSQEQLANKLGTSKSVISGYETGRNDPAQSMVIKLADSLGVSINWLMFGEEKEEPEEELKEEVKILAREANNLSDIQLDLIRKMIKEFEKNEDDK